MKIEIIIFMPTLFTVLILLLFSFKVFASWPCHKYLKTRSDAAVVVWYGSWKFFNIPPDWLRIIYNLWHAAS